MISNYVFECFRMLFKAMGRLVYAIDGMTITTNYFGSVSNYRILHYVLYVISISSLIVIVESLVRKDAH